MIDPTRFAAPHQLQPFELRARLAPAKAVCSSFSLAGKAGHTSKLPLGDGEREDGYTCEVHLLTARDGGRFGRWAVVLVPRRLECNPLDVLAVAWAMNLDYYKTDRVRRDSATNPAGFVYATAITELGKYAARQLANTTTARV